MLLLLTGATGFVGRQVLRELVNRNIPVRLVKRNRSDDSLQCQNTNIESVIVSPDLFHEDRHWWKRVCAEVDVVIHAAWYAKPGLYLQSSKNIDCLFGTINMAQGAIDAGVRRFVGIGTCLEYELSTCPISPDAPLNPLTPYAATKAAAYLSLSQLFASKDVGFAWCRLFNLYGDQEDSRRLAPYIRQKLSKGEEAELTSGDQIRDYMDVREAASQVVKVGLSDLQGAVNICSGIPISVRQFAEQIADEYGRRDLLRFGSRTGLESEPPCVVGVRTELPNI